MAGPSPRGVTLPELVVALVLTGFVSGGAIGVLRRTQDVYRAEGLRADLRQTLRAAAAFFPAELRELDAGDGDIAALGPTALTIRAPRALAFACRPPAVAVGIVNLTLRNAPAYGTRDFDPASDSVWILHLGSHGRTDSAQWRLGAVTALEPELCPDGAPGRHLTVILRAFDPPEHSSPILIGAPVLGFEQVTYLLYRGGDGLWYVGLRDRAGTQPLFGPVPPGGLAFTYFDSSGVSTTLPSRVAAVEVRLRVQAGPARGPGGTLVLLQDSVICRVALRNNRRF
jgi:hypothetical protein